jgi:thymidylate synthase (FAD)
VAEIPVLDKGFVRLDDSMADDLSVVNAARVSLAKHSELEKGWVWDEDHECDFETCGELNPDGRGMVCDYWHNYAKLKDDDAGLIRFLMKGRHGTPFEHNAFRFHVKAPIFVAREWMRHRIGSFNEWSGRYSKLEGEFYMPEVARSQTGKPGSYTFEALPEMTVRMRTTIENANLKAWYAYEWMLESGIAKEQARLVLPVNIYTQFYWTINARSLMNFLSLRNAEPAMYEIREYAKQIEIIFAAKMPQTHLVFSENGRVAP